MRGRAEDPFSILTISLPFYYISQVPEVERICSHHSIKTKTLRDRGNSKFYIQGPISKTLKINSPFEYYQGANAQSMLTSGESF